MLRFAAKLIGKWYVSLAAIVGLLDSAQSVARMLGHPLPEWPRIPLWVVVTVLLLTIFYGAYSLHTEALEEGRMKGKAEALSAGALLADVRTPATTVYSGKGKSRLIIFVYSVLRNSGSAAVRITDLRLVDDLSQQYHLLPKAGSYETNSGHIVIGPGTYFFPGVETTPNVSLELPCSFGRDRARGMEASGHCFQIPNDGAL